MSNENNLGESLPERDGVVGEVIDRRVQVYGNPVETFARIAEVWSGILGVHVNATDVPLCMAGMKMVRAQVMPDYSDNSDDIDGYMDIFRQLVGDDMIHARTVNEFIEKKWLAAEALSAPGRTLNYAGGVTAEDFDLPVEPTPVVNTEMDLCMRNGAHLVTTRHTVFECPAVRRD